MKIIVDAFGGDKAPLSVVEGAIRAKEKFSDITLVLTGDEHQIKQTAAKASLSLSGIHILHTPDVIQIKDNPMDIRHAKKNSSMGLGLSMLSSEEGDAFVSAGSTAALTIGASTLVRRIKGVKRAALAVILPSKTGSFMLIDAGANLDCRCEALEQFAAMGSIYAENVLQLKRPRVGLVNVGTEANKGTEIFQEAYVRLKKRSDFHFVGNVEARELLFGACDIAVSDGISGNMILKTMEGMGIFFVHALKDLFYHSFKTKIAASMVKSQLYDLKEKMDYTAYGGAILLGISKPVIKAHGSSDAKAIMNAIRQAKSCVDQRVTEKIRNTIEKEREKK